MLSKTKCNPDQTSIFWSSLRRLRGSRGGNAKFSPLVPPISVVTGQPRIKTNWVSGVNLKNLLHIQLDNYSRIDGSFNRRIYMSELIVANDNAENTVSYKGRTISNNDFNNNIIIIIMTLLRCFQ